jgi:transposase-like protein
MSHDDNTLKQRLRQHLENLEEVKEDKDWLRDLVEWLAQELLDVEFSEFVAAEPYERSEERQGYRNGYRQRDLFTRVGRLTLRVPRDREGRFSTQLLERYQRSEKALVLALQESYLQGVSTRKMRRITEKLCGVEFSKDQISRMAQALDEELSGWRQRTLEKHYPYLVIDARYEYIREDGRVESEGVLMVKGINQDGYREILSVAVAPGEDEATWGEVFANLLDRKLDLSAVRQVVSDEHRGLKAAVRRYFPGATRQRCQTHTNVTQEPKCLFGLASMYITNYETCSMGLARTKLRNEPIGWSQPIRPISRVGQLAGRYHRRTLEYVLFAS